MIWCTKYRYKTLRQADIKNACMKAIYDVANRHGMEIRDLVVDDDHVHAEVDVPPTMSVSEAFRNLKGGTAFRLFRQFRWLELRYPRRHLWSLGKIFRSISEVQQHAVENYIRKHHSYVQTSLAGYRTL